MAAKFIPRQIFQSYESIPRSYFLGHHRAGLEKMKKMMSSIDYVIECRDFRVPVTSINPTFEEALGGKPRLLVYTKEDLGGGPDAKTSKNKKLIHRLHAKTPIFFVDPSSKRSISPILKHLSLDAYGPEKLVACRAIVVGMPNVGKSTLINALRSEGMHKAKAARTGDQPGITRKIGTPIKVIERENGSNIYVLDTPGVFVPYMPDADRMLKLSLCGCIKDSIIPPTTMADFLLYHINLHDPLVYNQWHEPTNDITPLLDSYARQSGHLAQGGIPNIDLAALSFIQRWRAGKLGKFMLDDVQAEISRRKDAGEIKSRTRALKEIKSARLARQRQNSVHVQ